MIKPRFSPEINLGHLLQAGILIVTIGGGAITSYISLRADIQLVRSDLTIKVNEHETRLAAAEQGIKEMRDDEKDFQKDMRAALMKITDMLADVRVQVGHR